MIFKGPFQPKLFYDSTFFLVLDIFLQIKKASEVCIQTVMDDTEVH